ncbi:hypothetical protein [Microbulbifer halophilus]|uniref:hypothetical protein n=1 Tax=Microbulbifer halophilus TaxID=453963 RepID=UPI00360C0767
MFSLASSRFSSSISDRTAPASSALSPNLSSSRPLSRSSGNNKVASLAIASI